MNCPQKQSRQTKVLPLGRKPGRPERNKLGEGARLSGDGQQPWHPGSVDHGQESGFYSKGDWKTSKGDWKILQVLSREEEGSDLCFRHIPLLWWGEQVAVGVGVEPGGLRSSYCSDRGGHWAWTMGGQRDGDSRGRGEALWTRVGLRGGGTSGGFRVWAFCIPPLIQGGGWSQGPRFTQPPLPRQPWRKDPQGYLESPSPEAWTLDYDSEQTHKQVRQERTIGQAGKGFSGRRDSPWEEHVLSDLKGRACPGPSSPLSQLHAGQCSGSSSLGGGSAEGGACPVPPSCMFAPNSSSNHRPR